MTEEKISEVPASNPPGATRLERKFFISSLGKAEVEHIVKLHPAMFSEIYNQRYVNNIYFDYADWNNYRDAVVGASKRLKIRIRWYGALFGTIDTPVLELKGKQGLVGSKASYPLSAFALDRSLNVQRIRHVVDRSELPRAVEEELKSLSPTLLNHYSRKYYRSADGNFRITLDTDRMFFRLGRQNNSLMQFIRDDAGVILELKYDSDKDEDANCITNLFPFRLTKSSKYVSGIEQIYEF
jgi:SPX domain protein involved in polyphosphate accumulation